MHDKRLNWRTYSFDRSTEQACELQECQVVAEYQHENQNEKERAPMPPSAQML